MSLGCLVPLLAAIVIRYYIRAHWTRQYLADTRAATKEDLYEYTRSRCIRDGVRATFSVFCFCFEVLMVKSLNALVCVPVNGELRLQLEMDQVRHSLLLENTVGRAAHACHGGTRLGVL